ncbi:MAG: hypothetical protein ACYC5N_08810 [Endomicrobiales bacterium]
MIKTAAVLIGLLCLGGSLPGATVRGREKPAEEKARDGMRGSFGDYPLSREASGTSWQPDSSPMEGIHVMEKNRMLMLHGFIYGVYDFHGGPRGDSKFFNSSMLTVALQNSYKPGVLGLRAMFSLEPVSGKDGYPLLFQTGEAVDGRPLIDRQHPHDFFSELSVSYSVPVTGRSSLFAYAGLPGEPALGPPVYLHRFSGMNNPQAPITHHWFDSTHVTFGVATLGYVWDTVKFEGSAFRGREPDENHWDIETPELDSFSGRFSANFSRNWSFQASYGRLESPEEWEPGTDIGRYTASLIYNRSYQTGERQVTAAWGMNAKEPGSDLNAFLLESAFGFGKAHVLFFRIENVQKDGLFPPEDPRFSSVFTVNQGSLGYIFNLPAWEQIQFGVGALASISIPPDELTPFYGASPFSYMLFLRARIV